jgi:hypothetical protein
VRAVDVARKLSAIEEQCKDQSCLLVRGDYRNKVQNPEKLSWFRLLGKMVSVAEIVNTTEEWRRQDRSCLFGR